MARPFEQAVRADRRSMHSRRCGRIDVGSYERMLLLMSFCIQRSILASAIAVITVLAGSICCFLPPVAQFPNITRPQIIVSAQHPGASAQVVSDTVTETLEQQINGVQALKRDVTHPDYRQ
jgi:Cu/Ag efflux pump CusA